MKPNSAFHLIWERFINTQGLPGRNISMDLHLEHLNKFLKDLLKDLGNNMNEINADRVSKSMNNLKTIVENFEIELHISTQRSSENALRCEEDVKYLVMELMKDNPFLMANKPYASFPQFKLELLEKLDKDKFVEWVKSRTISHFVWRQLVNILKVFCKPVLIFLFQTKKKIIVWINQILLKSSIYVRISK